MSVTHARSVVAARSPGRLEPGVVLVADQLMRPGLPAIGCPAAVLVAGELRRRGVATVSGPLQLDPTVSASGQGSGEGGDDTAVAAVQLAAGGEVGGDDTAVAAVLPAAAGEVGLGV